MMIEVEKLTKSFGDFTAVRDLTISIKKKSGITALLGPNGAGKTTTLRLLTGFLKPTSGSITINDWSVTSEEELIEIKKRIGYLPETSPLYPEMLVSEFLQFIGQVRGLFGDELEKAAREMIDRLELGSHLYTPIGILSKGFRQRTALAGALIHKPSVIILDEPTSGLDPNQISKIRGLIREMGSDAVLILSTHILQEVEDICERVIIINMGKIVADASISSLQKAHSCGVVVRGKDVMSKLESFSIVRSCTKTEQTGLPEGFQKYICELHDNSPEKLFAEVAASGWEVRELAPSTRSLEDIFSELTN